MNRNLLWKILDAETDDLVEWIKNTLDENGYATINSKGSYLIGVPKVVPPIALVAHVDTIFRKGWRLTWETPQQKAVINSEGVLGADDRAGVFCIMEQIRRGHRPLVVFCDKEERGCLGAKDLAKDKKLDQWANDLHLLVEIDRQSSNDYVYYSHTITDEAKAYIEKHKYVKAWGSTSDVRHLTEATSIPHVNISAGYYNQHTPSERLVLSELQSTVDRVFSMLAAPDVPKSRIPEVPKYDYKMTRSYGNYNAWDREGYPWAGHNRGSYRGVETWDNTNRRWVPDEDTKPRPMSRAARRAAAKFNRSVEEASRFTEDQKARWDAIKEMVKLRRKHGMTEPEVTQLYVQCRNEYDEAALKLDNALLLEELRQEMEEEKKLDILGRNIEDDEVVSLNGCHECNEVLTVQEIRDAVNMGRDELVCYRCLYRTDIGEEVTVQ